jgi:hypothetical protein
MPRRITVTDDAIKLMAIKQKHAYYDKKSQHPYIRKIIKPKYKLATLQFYDLGQYLFFVFTSDRTACQFQFLFSVTDADWREKVPGVALPASYCDHTRHEWLEQSELLFKIRDPRNGFPYVARLSDEKYSELQTIVKKANESPTSSKEVREIVGKGILTTINGLASKLGIA